jgi:CheY-like chemotaxis protein
METITASSALVVDDNYFNRDLCTLALEHVGYQVVEAEDGIEALSILAKQTFDLLVVDLAMPQMDGATVIRKMRQQEIHNKMIVIVITANHHMATDEVDLSADYVMYKPIDIEEFALFAQRLVALKNRAQG